jgi:hypothetical protein
MNRPFENWTTKDSNQPLVPLITSSDIKLKKRKWRSDHSNSRPVIEWNKGHSESILVLFIPSGNQMFQ